MNNEVKLNVPKKYKERFGGLYREDDLIDGCKYELFFKNGYVFGGFASIPVFSKKEALDFIKESYKGKEI